MQLSIAYINDVHGYLEPLPELFFKGGKVIIETAVGYSRIVSIIKDIRKSNTNTLLFDGGDTFHGTLPLIHSKGEAIVPILNIVGFNAMVGHWDFAYGSAVNFKYAIGRPFTPVVGSEYHEEYDVYEPLYGPGNSERYDNFRRLDLRFMYFHQLFGRYFIVFYLEAIN